MACFHLHLKGDGTNNTSVIAMASLVHTGTGVGFLILIGRLGGGGLNKRMKIYTSGLCKFNSIKYLSFDFCVHGCEEQSPDIVSADAPWSCSVHSQ